jgi:hypothetical protein
LKIEKKPVRGFLVATIVAAILAFAYFYFTLPALNIHNPDAFIFLGAIFVVWCSLYAMFSTSLRFRKQDEPAAEPHSRDYLDVDEDGNVIRKRHANQGGKKITDLAVFSMKVPLAMLIVLVVIFVLYLAESVKIYRKRQFEGFAEYIGMGIFIAVAGFMVSGLVNDTTIQMMPLVYVFLGMGFAINCMLQKKTKE